LDISGTVQKMWPLYLPQKVEASWVLEDPIACERFYNALREIFVDRGIVRRGWGKVGGRRLATITTEWDAWAIIAKLLRLKSAHPVDAIAERFLTTESPDEALEQLVKGFTLFIRSAKHSKKRPRCGKGGKS